MLPTGYFTAYQKGASIDPFTSAVISSMRKLYPEALVDKSRDNTGLLLEATPTRSLRDERKCRTDRVVLLTIDLTRHVVREAISKKASVIVAYHPIIFDGLKSVTCAEPQQRVLLELIEAGISVYCPHTAVDAVPEYGLGDWLADICTGNYTKTNLGVKFPVGGDRTSVMDAEHYTDFYLAILKKRPGKYDVIKPVAMEGMKEAGMGRIVSFWDNPVAFETLKTRIFEGLGLSYLQIAYPQGLTDENLKRKDISRIAVCPGSGDSLIKDLKLDPDFDMIFTGELSHQAALTATERGIIVVTAFHSNTERGYLKHIMKPKLEEILFDAYHRAVESDIQQQIDRENFRKDSSVQVLVSEVDRDPYATFGPKTVAVDRAGAILSQGGLAGVSIKRRFFLYDK
ncbi:GTP cyclohydrolase 1 type 2/Nif3 [Trichophaea hybrida]|nr:GTP cyclohydrolase 1 type 2/Nif3 [Trichophaea hybrida]